LKIEFDISYQFVGKKGTASGPWWSNVGSGFGSCSGIWTELVSYHNSELITWLLAPPVFC